MIRILVVEDEGHSRERLVDLLAGFPQVEVVAQAENGPMGLAMALEHQPDLVFLDVEMPGIKGTSLIRLLHDLHPAPAVVFVTAYPDYTLEAFAEGALHYLMKPVEAAPLAQALARVQARIEPKTALPSSEPVCIPVRRKGGLHLLKPAEVEALVADLGDCMAWTREGRLPVDGSLGFWEERLVPHGYLRAHRNALVRLDAVKALSDDDEVVLSTGRFQVSRRRLDAVRRALGLG